MIVTKCPCQPKLIKRQIKQLWEGVKKLNNSFEGGEGGY